MEKGKNIKNTYPVLGMSCASCAARVDKTLGDYIQLYTVYTKQKPDNDQRISGFCFV